MEPDEVDRFTVPRDRELRTRDEGDARLPCGVVRLLEPGEFVVIGKCEHVDAVLGGPLDDVSRG